MITDQVLEAFRSLVSIVPLVRTFVVVVLILVVMDFVLIFLKRLLLRKARSKKQISNIEIFTKIFKYIGFLIVLIFAILSYAGSWTGFGVAAGLMSAALGWALQRPITGMAAWIMLVVRRPFEIGDRIIVANMRGDVADISLTHIYLKEVGGVSSGDENSGRVIMIPNAILFEQTIINYTKEDEYILDEVTLRVTYSSDLDLAVKLVEQAARQASKEFLHKVDREPYVRTYFDPSWIDVRVKYFTPAKKRQEMQSAVTQAIYHKVKKTERVDFAYPHMEIVYKGQDKE